MDCFLFEFHNRQDLRGHCSSSCQYDYVHLRNFDEYSLELLFEKIFKCKVIEIKKDVYHPERGKCKYLPAYHFLEKPVIGLIYSTKIYT